MVDFLSTIIFPFNFSHPLPLLATKLSTYLTFHIKFVNMYLVATLVAVAIRTSNPIAHPGHDIHAEMAQRAAFMQTSKRDLSHCAAKMKARGMDQRTVTRRAAMAKRARKKRSIATGT
jgi:hypothetical protein